MNNVNDFAIHECGSLRRNTLSNGRDLLINGGLFILTARRPITEFSTRTFCNDYLESFLGSYLALAVDNQVCHGSLAVSDRISRRISKRRHSRTINALGMIYCVRVQFCIIAAICVVSLRLVCDFIL